jgi:hypothetical protein
MLKNAHLRRCPHPSSLRRTFKYASLLTISGALHLAIFEHPAKAKFFSNLPVLPRRTEAALPFRDPNGSKDTLPEGSGDVG